MKAFTVRKWYAIICTILVMNGGLDLTLRNYGWQISVPIQFGLAVFCVFVYAEASR